MLNKPVILIEDKIPFIKGRLEAYADVRYLAPQEFTPQAVKDADAMIIRTRTRCDAQLLSGSRVRCIATATIGTDHIDIDWCRSQGIAVYNAPGCNAPAVAQYVWASLLLTAAPAMGAQERAMTNASARDRILFFLL